MSTSYPLGERIRNFFSVVVGVVVFFGLMFAVFPFLDETHKRLIRPDAANLEKNVQTMTVIYISMFAAILIICGFLAGIIATRKKILHAVITGVVLIGLYFWALGDSINWESVKSDKASMFQNIMVPATFIVGTLIGGWIASLFRRKKRLETPQEYSIK